MVPLVAVHVYVYHSSKGTGLLSSRECVLATLSYRSGKKDLVPYKCFFTASTESWWFNGIGDNTENVVLSF